MAQSNTKRIYNQRTSELQSIERKTQECRIAFLMKQENGFPDYTKKFILHKVYNLSEKAADKHVYLESHTHTGDMDTCMCFSPDLSQNTPLATFKREFIERYKSISPLQMDCDKQTRIHLDLLKAQELEGRIIEKIIQLANTKLEGLNLYEDALKMNLTILQDIKYHLISRITAKDLNIDLGSKSFLPKFVEQYQTTNLPRKLSFISTFSPNNIKDR